MIAFVFVAIFTQASRAQTTLVDTTKRAVATHPADSSLHTDSTVHRVDSVRQIDTKPLVSKPFKRPIAYSAGSNTVITNEAVRYYGSPQTFSAVVDESVSGFPLVLGDQGYGRETFLSTSRVSEPLVSTFLNGVLPLNDPIDGNSILNYFPVELASDLTIMHGGAYNSLDHATSDAVNAHIETFRAPIAYTRFHYTQELSHSFSNFEGLFSVNASAAMNFVLAVYRRTAGAALTSSTLNLNPRNDDWWIRTQANYDTKAVHALFFLLYTTAFSGTNGGIFKIDSSADIFDEQLAPVKYPKSYDHRTRLDILAQSGFSLFSEKDPTELSAYVTISSRRLFAADTNFTPGAASLRTGDRFGFSFEQPAVVSIGEFSTRALVRADAQVLSRTTQPNVLSDILEKRYSALASDSIALGGAFGISANGFFRWTVSALTLDGINQPSLALTNFGLQGSARLSRALSLTADLTYSRDRAVQSPNPTATYELKNLGAFVSLGIPLGVFDSIGITAGVLDRVEPEGVVLTPVDNNDSIYTPTFSSTAIHSRGINGSLQFWFDRLRFSAQAEYLPSVHPVSLYTNIPALRSDITARIFGSTGLYYENDVAEGNLRLSLGARMRYYNTIVPSLSYDPASDYYVYRGLPRFGTDAIVDSRLTKPRYILDVVISALIDQRAQVNVGLLNILGTPYFNVPLYPREGFTFRLDVTWAFLD